MGNLNLNVSVNNHNSRGFDNNGMNFAFDQSINQPNFISPTNLNNIFNQTNNSQSSSPINNNINKNDLVQSSLLQNFNRLAQNNGNLQNLNGGNQQNLSELYQSSY